MSSKNCWETLQCKRQDNCPAYPHHGRNCFAVTGTTCRGKMQGSYDEKIGACRATCPFYNDLMRLDDWENLAAG
jgi:hypothetical protein